MTVLIDRLIYHGRRNSEHCYIGPGHPEEPAYSACVCVQIEVDSHIAGKHGCFFWHFYFPVGELTRGILLEPECTLQ
jgi:hypothetical protein